MSPVNEQESGSADAGPPPPPTTTTSSNNNNGNVDDFLASLDDHDAKDILDALNFMEEHGTDLTPNPVFSGSNSCDDGSAGGGGQRLSAPSPTLSGTINNPNPGAHVVSMGPPRPPSATGGKCVDQNASNSSGGGGSSSSNNTSQQPTKKPAHPFFFYRDFSNLQDPDPATPITAPGRIPNFPAKMYAILSRSDLTDIITWMPHGRSWRVLKPREFEVKVIPTYFEHSKFSSFIRQANGWGFRRIISKGPDRNSYYHELFLRGKPHLIKLMRRPPPSSKPLADASTEPDFYSISKSLPLPELKDDDGAMVAQNFPRQVAYSFVPPAGTQTGSQSAHPTGSTSPGIAALQQAGKAPVPPTTVSMTAQHQPQNQQQHIQAHGYYPSNGAPPAPPAGTAVTYITHPPHPTAHGGAPPGTQYTAVYTQQPQVQHVMYATTTTSTAVPSPQFGAMQQPQAPAPQQQQQQPSMDYQVNYDLGEDPLMDMFDKPFNKVDSSDNLLDLLAKPMPPPEYYGSHTFVPLLD